MTSRRPMNVARPLLVVVIVVATILVAGCTGGTSSPSPSMVQLNLTDVTTALANAGIKAADVADNLDARAGAWHCLPGSFRLARVSQQPPAAMAHPGDKPSVDVLIFPTEAERAASQSAIGADGQVRAQGCAAMVDWVGAPHAIGVRNVILFVASDDPAAVSAVESAANRLGS
jgi:hypothetical protein